MAKKFTVFLIFILIINYKYSISQNIITPFELSTGNETPEYADVLKYYSSLVKAYPNIKIYKKGNTDTAEPMFFIELSKGSKDGKVNILINNGIHPGEPEGIEASMLLARDILAVSNNNKLAEIKNFKQLKPSQFNFNDVLTYANIYIIPVYNIDGAKNRNKSSRVNQNGPIEYGFRANANNLDLNRDFIKLDSKNSVSFVELFQQIKPHVFIDTHTSNGADYPYTVTYIASQKDKLHPLISEYQQNMFIQKLKINLTAQDFSPFVYVNAWGSIPDSGWNAFYDSPRYSTGYTSLFNCISFTLETHMLKPYAQRVEGSYAFLANCIIIATEDSKQIIMKKELADKSVQKQTNFDINWRVDSFNVSKLNYQGYKASYKTSEVTGLQRLYYDRSTPIQTKIKYYDNYIPLTSVQAPKSYIIPAQWDVVISKLIKNGVRISKFEKDTVLQVGVYYIDKYKTASNPFEGHYIHSNTKVSKQTKTVKISKGDYIVTLNQTANRFIVECLEPEAVDSYFNWNFFDAILSQKEGYSDYVFEDTAAELIKKYPDLKLKLNKYLSSNPKLKNNADAQLDFIYKNSPYYEESYLRYPIYRLENDGSTAK